MAASKAAAATPSAHHAYAQFKRKHLYTRLLTKVLFFTAGLILLTAFKSNSVESLPSDRLRREDNATKGPTGAPEAVTLHAELFSSDETANGAFLVYLIGIFYMFVALAIICDEFFVPALEVIEDVGNISPNVAGATLMAAGGSAPELATSFIGTFLSKSNVGFGTIVGSAVFNILFVIGMCALFTDGTLVLTAWPLARDSGCYIVSLFVLTMFIGVSSPDYIETWEAAVLLGIYVCYIGVAYSSDYLEKIAAARFPVFAKREPTQGADAAEDKYGFELQPGQIQAGADAPGIIDADSPPRKASIQVKRSIIAKAHTRRVTSKHAVRYNKVDNKVKQLRKKSVGAFLAHNVVEKKSLMAFFSSLKVDERGEVTKKSFEEFCMPNDSKSGVPNMSEQEVNKIFADIDTDGNGNISKQEMLDWFCLDEVGSQCLKERLLLQIEKEMLEYIDHNDVPTQTEAQGGKTDDIKLARATVEGFLKERFDFDSYKAFNPHLRNTVDNLFKKASPDLNVNMITFTGWYYEHIREPYNEGLEKDAEAKHTSTHGSSADDDVEPISWPRSLFGYDEDGNASALGIFLTICTAPLMVPLLLTVPDVNNRANPDSGVKPKFLFGCFGDERKLFPVAFVMSILWIAFVSYFMVSWTEIVGASWGIGIEVMALTLVAAGTSVPDLITSVLVAQAGEGDMAVSSSIGSNIFDVTVGLPLPWLIFTLVESEKINVRSPSLVIMVILLLVVLIAVITSIACLGWTLNKRLGGFMFVFYFLYLAVHLILVFVVKIDE